MIWVPKKLFVLPSRQRGFFTLPGGMGANRPSGVGGATDPNFSSVSALLHMDGSDGSTSFPDSSPVSKTWTANGNAQVDTAQSKFGGASLLIDGSGDYLSTPAGSTPRPMDFSGQFTIEGWFRVNSFANNFSSIFASATGTFTVLANAIMVLGSSQGANAQKLSFVIRGNQSNIVGTTALSNSTWYYFAATRDGSNVIRLFLDGNLEGSATNSNSIEFQSTGTRIGSNGWDGANGYFNGWIDDLRVTKGVARYTSSFTPPSAAFPNS